MRRADSALNSHRRYQIWSFDVINYVKHRNVRKRVGSLTDNDSFQIRYKMNHRQIDFDFCFIRNEQFSRLFRLQFKHDSKHARFSDLAEVSLWPQVESIEDLLFRGKLDSRIETPDDRLDRSFAVDRENFEEPSDLWKSIKTNTFTTFSPHENFISNKKQSRNYF